MNVLITGGGTGGHLSIAKALALSCKAKGFGVYYIGSTSGQDRLWFEGSDIFSACYFLESSGVVNKRGFARFKALYLQIKAMFASLKILKKHDISAVVSVGGFSAGGASFASVVARIPLFIHEQNATLGTLNKILSIFARARFCSFDLRGFIKTSYPINSDFFTFARDRKRLETIIFIGGSQGASAINAFALEVAGDLLDMGIGIIHQCGKLDFESLCEQYKNMGLVGKNFDEGVSFRYKNGCEVVLFSFSKRLLSYITKADFCVSRSGASSLWELCANRLPAIFVPYPYAAKNHQYLNALSLGDLCKIILQDRLDKKDFLSYIDTLDLRKASENLKGIISPNGADEIISSIASKLDEI